MIAEIEYEETLQEIGAVALALAACGEKHDYGFLVRRFESTAATLSEGANARMSEICDDRDVVQDSEWQHSTLFLADELERYPALLLCGRCEPGYETLRAFHAEWAEACEALGVALKALACDAGDDELWPQRINRAEEALSVVAAHDKARAIYLRELRARND